MYKKELSKNIQRDKAHKFGKKKFPFREDSSEIPDVLYLVR